MTDSIDIRIDASPEIRAALERIGRTEDVRFSPDNRRLALPSYDHNSIAIVDVDLALDRARPTVSMTSVVEHTAPGLDYPHGIEFLDDETIVVANRNAEVSIFRLPGAGATELVPVGFATASGFDQLHGPSSLAMKRRPDGDTEVLVGHRFADMVTRHVLQPTDSGAVAVTENEVLLRRWITIVDGAAVSCDGRWLALSNPWHQHVLVYDTESALDEESDPACVLRGASYPHGVRFSPDGRHLLVADAGSPYLHVHTSDGKGWQGVQYPTASARAMTDEVFARGRYNCREGGPKGVDVDRTSRVVAVTSECQPLAFFDFEAVLGHAPTHRVQHDVELQYELALVQAADALVTERIGALEKELADIRRSRSYQLAQRLRRVHTARTKWLR